MFETTATIIEFGELPRDSERLLNGIWSISRDLLDKEQILGLVVDLPGDTEEYADWHGFFAEGKPYDGPCPNLLCFRKDMKTWLPVACQGHLQTIRAHHVLVYDGEMKYVLEGRQ